MKRRRYLVTGRVQGVGYRYFTLEAATRLGVSGFARNLSDGRVEVVGVGDDGVLERFLAALRQGPPAARVFDVVDIALGDDEDPSFDAFTILETR